MEQYIMHCKATLFLDSDTAAAVMDEQDPGRQKMLGKQVKKFDKYIWEKELERITEIGLSAKFNQNPHLKEKLLNTRGKSIGEACRDTFWGTGLELSHRDTLDCSKWKSNTLGRLIVNVRDTQLK